eukprot:1291033-Ditylum_brightwellii.AAC.1
MPKFKLQQDTKKYGNETVSRPLTDHHGSFYPIRDILHSKCDHVQRVDVGEHSFPGDHIQRRKNFCYQKKSWSNNGVTVSNSRGIIRHMMK